MLRFGEPIARFGEPLGKARSGGGGVTLEQFAATLNLSWWIQADLGDIASLENDAAVAAWDDQSTNVWDVAQSTESAKPTYKTNVLNSLPIVRFDGGDWLLSSSVAGTNFFSTNEGTLVFVMKQTGTQADNALFVWRATTASNAIQALLSFSNNLFYDFGATTLGGRISGAQPSGWDDAWHIVELHRESDGSGLITVDGVDAVSATFTDDLTNTASGAFNLGSLNGTTFFLGDLYAAYFSKTALSDDNRQELRRLLSLKTGIEVTFP